MSKQPEALRLAGHIEGLTGEPWCHEDAAAMIRRQHALIEEMREALACAGVALRTGHRTLEAIDKTAAALAKAEAQQ